MPSEHHGQDPLPHAISRLADEIGSLARAVNNNQAIIDRIALAERNIMITQQELAAGLKAVTAQQGKIATEQAAKSDELLAKIAALQAIIDAGGNTVSDEVETAFNEVKAASQALDDVIPDPPAPPV